MTPATFAVRLVLASGLLYGYYHYFLRNKLFHRYNRLFLLAIIPLGFVLAMVSIPIPWLAGSSGPTSLPSTLSVIMEGSWEEPIIIYPGGHGFTSYFSGQQWLIILYCAGIATGLFRLLQALLHIRKLSARLPAREMDGCLLYLTEAPGAPFSFFNRIFWDRHLSLESLAGRQALAHEQYHVRQHHSADRLLLEIACCAGWFNPFFYHIRRELMTLHEFMADAAAARLADRSSYAEMLLHFAGNGDSPQLTHPMFNNQLKRRITMLIHPHRRYSYGSRLFAIPVLLLLTCAFTFRYSTAHPGRTGPTDNFTVVVDPGHGGSFTGAQNSNGLLEKDINLAIAQKIKALGGRYQVNVVLTRSSDQPVGNAGTLAADLQNRIAFSRAIRPDLFISIHTNADNNSATQKTGFEAYLSGKKSDQPALLLALSLLTSLKTLYSVDEHIHESATGVAVLDKTECPSVLLECGYLNNPADALFISTEANQEKIAEKILGGIVNYRQQLTEEKHPAIVRSSAAAPADTTPDPTRGFGKLFTKVEIEPQYPGGNGAWGKYLFKTLIYPQAAIDKEIKGTVLLQFIVDTAGRVSTVEVLSGPPLLRAESIRVIKASGPWIPARQNGRTVNAYKRQPITYALSEPKKIN